MENADIKSSLAFSLISEDARDKIFADLLAKDTLGHESSLAVADFNWMIQFFRQLADSESAQFTRHDISFCFRAAIWIINYLSAADPSQLHYHVAREVLKAFGGDTLANDERARDLLARALVRECNSLASQIIPKEMLQGNIKEERKSMSFSGMIDSHAQHLIYQIDGKLWLDDFFIRYISKFGEEGKKTAQEFSEKSKEWFQEYNINKKALDLFRWWIDLKREPYYCRYIEKLASILWKDEVEKQFNRAQKQIPALTQGIHPSVTRILSPKSETKEIENQIHMIHNGKIIASLPTIDPKLIPIVTRGAGNLNSIYHHKLLRFECRSGFENWIQGLSDARVLRFERGCTEIAERLGLTSNRAIEEIKALLNAQAYMHFKFDDRSSGNLIVMRNFRSKKCNREDGIEIVLGTQLLPHYTFQTSKRERLLIPVPELPPLVSAPQYHAGQALLQMMVMEAFTSQSIELANTGTIVITSDKWKQFAKETGLPESVFKQTLERWVQDGDDEPMFLISPEANRYTLGPAYKKELDFLRYQGALRKQRQKDGEKSAITKKTKTHKVDSSER